MAVGYFKQVFVAVDQLANALAGGWADETWSSRCWREGRQCWVVSLDALFGKGHCKESYYSEQQRLQEPPELRDA